MQSLAHTRPQQFVMMDFEEVVHDEPDRLFRGHPLQMIEAGQVYGPGKCTQSPLPPQIEIKIEIRHGEFAKGTMHGLAIAASSEIGFRHRSPVSIHAVDGEDVVGVVLSLEIQEQRRKAVGSQRRCRENRSFKTVRSIFAKYTTGRPRRVSNMIGHVVKKTLNAVWVFEAAQLAQFGGSEHVCRGTHRCRQFRRSEGRTALTTEDTDGTEESPQQSAVELSEQFPQFFRFVYHHIRRGFTQCVRSEAVSNAASPHAGIAAGEDIN